MNAEDKTAIVRVCGLSKEFFQRRPLTRTKITIQALIDVNLTVRRGTTLAIVGESGAGKSTLIRCLSLIEKPTAGQIWWNDTDLLKLRGKRLFAMRRRIQVVFQDPASALNPSMTAQEIIEEPLVIQKIGIRSERRELALKLMEQVGLPEKCANKLPFEFSGGQRQRLAIARALALEPNLLILDEALSNLDLANQDMILRLLSDLQAARSLTYIHVSHDLRLMEGIADEVAVMQNGRIVEQKDTNELFLHPEQPYTQELLEAAPLLDSIVQARLAWDCR